MTKKDDTEDLPIQAPAAAPAKRVTVLCRSGGSHESL